MSDVIRFPFGSRTPEKADDWIMDVRVMRRSDGRIYALLAEVAGAEFERDETASDRMRRLGLTAIEASAGLLVDAAAIAD